MISDYLRLKKEQKNKINQISKKINQNRLNENLSTKKDSEILHKIIDEALNKVKTNDIEPYF